MAVKIGGFLIHRHNEICDFTADCLREVCVDVEVEPQLQPLTTTSLALSSEKALPTAITVTSGQKGCRPTRGTTRLSMSGFFTQTAPAIFQQLCQPCTSALRRKRNVSMARECERLSSAPIPPLFFLPQVEWELKLRLSADAWLDSCRSRKTCLFTWK